MIILIPLAFATQECKGLMQPSDTIFNCSITSLWNYTAPCSGHNATVYNLSGVNVVNLTYANYGSNGLCFTIWNISRIGSYIGRVDNGDSFSITIEGDKQMMGFTVVLFLIIINIGVFLIPFLIRSFTDNKSTDYIIKHLFWMGGVLFLWFNMTILRQMAVDAGLGIDAQLQGYWWFFTLLAVCIIFAMVYVTAVGAVRMSQEIKMNERMGNDEQIRY